MHEGVSEMLFTFENEDCPLEGMKGISDCPQIGGNTKGIRQSREQVDDLVRSVPFWFSGSVGGDEG